MSEKQELVKQDNQLATNPQGVGLGFEGMKMESVSMPRAKLLQANSPEITEEEFADYGFRAGQVVHSLLMEKLPEVFIPISIWDSNTLFIPREEHKKESLKVKVKETHGEELTPEDMSQMFLCRAHDGLTGDRYGKCSECRLCYFNGNEKPYGNANINVLVLFEGEDLPVVVQFSATSHKHGKKFKDLAFFASGGKRPLFERKYKLTTSKKSKDGNQWYEMLARPAGKTTEEEFEFAHELYNKFAKVIIDVDDTPDHQPEEDSAY